MTDEELRTFDPSERGLVTWHSSEEDGGPDVGISVGLGDGQSLYFGDMPTSTLEDHGINIAETGDGWWLVFYGAGRNDQRIVGPLTGSEDARLDVQEIAEHIAGALRRGIEIGKQDE